MPVNQGFFEIINHFQETVGLAEAANDTISRAKKNYVRGCEVAKEAYEADLLGEKGYRDRLKELEAERDSVIEGGLSQILKVVDGFDAEMDEIGRLDGSKIDDGTLKLLNSGITLSSRDWQQLADQHKDNAVMTRILEERYDANRPQEKEPVVVKFGQSPEHRKEVFSKFARTIYHSCKSGAVPSLSGSGKFKTATDYYNHLARASIEDMQPFGEESFDNLNVDFPVVTASGKIEDLSGRQTDYNPMDFNFNFTPVRGNDTGNMF